jgi:hypothetical protein
MEFSSYKEGFFYFGCGNTAAFSVGQLLILHVRSIFGNFRRGVAAYACLVYTGQVNEFKTATQ